MRVHEDGPNQTCFCTLRHSVCSYKIKLGIKIYIYFVGIIAEQELSPTIQSLG